MFSRLTSILWPARESDKRKAPDCSSDGVGQISRKRSFDEIDQFCSELTLEDGDNESVSDSARLVKRPRLREQDDGDSEESEWRISTEASSHDNISEHSNWSDRADIKPPPPVVAKPKGPHSGVKLTPQRHGDTASRADDDQHIGSSEHTSSTPHRPDAQELFEAERARRRAEAESLGPGSGSGIISSADHELFIHLSMRGYDPLIPSHWMLDFRTLPLVLFAPPGGADEDDAKPLIHAMHGSEFRATKALRELFETGKKVRDKVVFCPNARPEPVLRKAVDKYMNWCLKDAKLTPEDQPSLLPVHCTVMRRPDQMTADIVNELEARLHALAQRHGDARGYADDSDTIVMPSIEIDDASPLPDDTPSPLPTLFGILLTHSLVYIFSFDANTASYKRGMRAALDGEEQEQEESEKLSMHYIAKFDFSDATMDVWNAFSVAIMCMVVRKVMLEQERPKKPADKGSL